LANSSQFGPAVGPKFNDQRCVDDRFDEDVEPYKHLQIILANNSGGILVPPFNCVRFI